MRVAVLQLSAQGMSSTKLYNYIRIASKNDVKLILLGEYILNPFFKELESMSLAMIHEQALHQSKVLEELSTTYNMVIVAPLVKVKKDKIYKTIMKFTPSGIATYMQQILINYSHWNEEKFFANKIESLKAPLTFKVDGLKFAVMSGFETHFDELWMELKNIDCVLVPSVSTFDSYERWKALLLTRAFTHNCYVLRANRIGEYKEENINWQFYGDSFLAGPYGELLEHLGNKEELMIAELSHSDVLEARKLWKFKEHAKKRE
ncbi:MAG: carbon-nitrogen hydrolase family protein [Sulfurimonadaceae bacterium]|jgi:predicted amidohydrolase|nr:carbon-nitrogen hydrolase family protein [Sulfurimonadaceae bacterium]